MCAGVSRHSPVLTLTLTPIPLHRDKADQHITPWEPLVSGNGVITSDSSHMMRFHEGAGN